jgi:hypothetical protein
MFVAVSRFKVQRSGFRARFRVLGSEFWFKVLAPGVGENPEL